MPINTSPSSILQNVSASMTSSSMEDISSSKDILEHVINFMSFGRMPKDEGILHNQIMEKIEIAFEEKKHKFQEILCGEEILLNDINGCKVSFCYMELTEKFIVEVKTTYKSERQEINDKGFFNIFQAIRLKTLLNINYIKDILTDDGILNLKGVNLSGAKLYHAYLVDADLSDANLSNAYLEHAILFNANLSNADLRYANLSDNHLEAANLSNANLENADLNDVSLEHANLSNANLRKTNLRYANLSNADLSGANLENADLVNANLDFADLRNANLSNANLTDVSLEHANLRNANLRNANLSKANLSNADLSNADLIRADLSKADLRKAELGNANLTKADLWEARMDDNILNQLSDSLFQESKAEKLNGG